MMFTSFARISILILVAFVFVTNGNEPQRSIVRIYSNLAEIIQPVGTLPLEFTSDDWNDIRSDSITLLGKNLDVISQTITEKKRSLNGADVYIRSPVTVNQASIMFVKATLIDETKNLVKVQDESISGKEALFFTVPSDYIYYLEEPSDSKFYVDFTYNTSNSKAFISYLRANLNWRTQYQLNIYNDKSDLIVMANIRNEGKSSVSVDQAELFSGDINLRIQQQQYRSYKMASSNLYFAGKQNDVPTIEEGEELVGVYVFSINKRFVIDGKTNYLLPMFHPQIIVERYNSISKSFSAISNNGKAQRSYRLRSDRYLPRGNCIIRELDRVVGETVFPNLAAKDKYDFSIGEDADVIYKENVTLISLTNFRQDVTNNSDRIETRTRSIYEIHIQVKNFKNHPVKIEYTQMFNSLKLKFTKSNDTRFVQDGLSIKCKMNLSANDDQVYSYTVELVNY